MMVRSSRLGCRVRHDGEVQQGWGAGSGMMVRSSRLGCRVGHDGEVQQVQGAGSGMMVRSSRSGCGVAGMMVRSKQVRVQGPACQQDQPASAGRPGRGADGGRGGSTVLSCCCTCAATPACLKASCGCGVWRPGACCLLEVPLMVLPAGGS